MLPRPWIVILCSLVATACSVTPQKNAKTPRPCPRSAIGEEFVIERSHESVPQWALKVPAANEYLYYVGTGSARTLAAAQDLAYMNAVLKLVRSLGVVYAVESRARFTDLGSFLDVSIKGVPIITLARRAEVEEVFFVKKEVVRAMFGGRAEKVEVAFETMVKVRYPREEWERFRRRIGWESWVPGPVS